MGNFLFDQRKNAVSELMAENGNPVEADEEKFNVILYGRIPH